MVISSGRINLVPAPPLAKPHMEISVMLIFEGKIKKRSGEVYQKKKKKSPGPFLRDSELIDMEYDVKQKQLLKSPILLYSPSVGEDH